MPGIQKCDIRRLPFSSEYADYILLDNVLEHVNMADVPMVLYEVRRVLKPGGRCVIAVPDFACLARQWLEMDKLDFFDPIIHKWIAETIYGNQAHEGEFHRAPMSPHYLNYVLQMCGFRNYSMDRYPMGAMMPMPEKFPGVNPKHESCIMRNDCLYVDIRK